MATVRFTANVQRHVSCPDIDVPGATLGEVLEGYFQTVPAARGYVLDDQGSLRQHMAAFIDGRQIRDRGRLTDVVAGAAVVDIVQSLSGG